MPDYKTPDQRHKIMAAIRAKNTKPEIIVRKYLWSHGYRYRLNHTRLPGKPDIVLRKYRTCIFVNGCFWHGHEGCRYYSVPKSNTDFWKAKISRNQERGAEVKVQLTQMGWNCITIWECELKPDKKENTLESLICTLSIILLQGHKVKKYDFAQENNIMMVADDSDIDDMRT